MIKFINRLSIIILFIVLFVFLDAYFFNIWLDPTFIDQHGSSVAIVSCIVLLIYVATLKNNNTEESTSEDEELIDTADTVVIRNFYYTDGDQKFLISVSDCDGISVLNLRTSNYIGYMKDGKQHFSYRKNGKNITKNVEKLLLELKEEGENNAKDEE